jgi:hypothetical protein
LKIISLFILAIFMLLAALLLHFIIEGIRWRQAFRKHLLKHWDGYIDKFLLDGAIEDAYCEWGINGEATPESAAETVMDRWRRDSKDAGTPEGEQRIVTRIEARYKRREE